MIENIKKKLDGKIPVTREDLIELVSSWGRKRYVFTRDKINIERCEPKEKYPFQKDKTLNVLSNRVLHLVTKLPVVSNLDA